jgi:hypothetical protein
MSKSSQREKKREKNGGDKKEASDTKCDLTLANILAGFVNYPKAEIYHSRQKLPKFKRTADEDVYDNEVGRIDALDNAVALAADGLDKLTDEVIDEKWRSIASFIIEEEIPIEFIAAACKRVAKSYPSDAQRYLDVWWPVTVTTRPFNPSSACLGACKSVGPDMLCEKAASVIVKEWLHHHMRKECSSSNEAVLSMCKLCRSKIASDGLRVLEGDFTTVLDFCEALVQEGGTKENHLHAVQALEDGLVPLAEKICQITRSTYWSERIGRVYSVGVNEAIAEPIIAGIVKAMDSDPDELTFESKFQLCQNEFPLWKKQTLGKSMLAKCLVSIASSMEKIFQKQLSKTQDDEWVVTVKSFRIDSYAGATSIVTSMCLPFAFG